MTNLLDRLKAAEVGSRELDAEIAVLFGVDGAVSVVSPLADSIFSEVPGWCLDACDRSVRAPEITTSLDAALALAKRVLPGLCWSVGQNVHHKLWIAYGLHILPDGEVETVGLDSAPTPALALCIAILTASAAVVSSNEKEAEHGQ